jgi:hypothetical protein
MVRSYVGGLMICKLHRDGDREALDMLMEDERVNLISTH